MKTQMSNRAALTVIPKQPYIDWANSLDELEPKLDINDPHYEFTVYLVDEVADEAAVARALRRHYPYIFEHELVAWYRDEKDWPQQRDFRTFKAWFEVKVSSVVLDLCRRPFETEELEI